MNKSELLGLLARLFQSKPWPKPFHLLQALSLIKQGKSDSEAAASVGGRRTDVARIARAKDPLRAALGSPRLTAGVRRKARQVAGQMLVGRCAELAFVEIYKAEMHTTELELRDLREDRSDTDYRLYNGSGRPIYRINIKFHGSRFRKAAESVGLDPHDCFALATYKIHGALKKHIEDKLPYFFAIVGVPALPAEEVGAKLPAGYLELISLVHASKKIVGKRDLEDRIVDLIVEDNAPVFSETYAQISGAEWYVLSAKRAYRLLQEKLFDRVFALRLPRFTRAFPGAEVDMHFSLREDLTPLRRYLSTLRDHGPHMITTLLERGDY